MVELAKGKDLTIESYSPVDDKPWFIFNPRISGVVKSFEATRRIHEPPMHNDTFLNYLEWKSRRSWFGRWGLP